VSGPGRHFELRRRTRRGTDAARLRGTGEARTWAGAQWLTLLETMIPEPERRAGLELARGGQVAGLQVGAGLVEANVRGAAPAPSRVRLEVATLGAEQWHRVVDAMASEAFYLAKLLAREVPAAIDALLAPQALVPGPDEVSVQCTCSPAGAGRCRHAAAVIYLVAGLVDDDPLAALALRGMQGERLLERLTAARAQRVQGPSAAHTEPRPPAAPEATRPLEQCLEDFWRPGAQLAELQRMPPPHHAPHALLRRLGPSPLTGRFPLVGLLQSVYDEVARHALKLRDRAEGIEPDEPRAWPP
jgi:uncharacterized Zn finger protein